MRRRGALPERFLAALVGRGTTASKGANAMTRTALLPLLPLAAAAGLVAAPLAAQDQPDVPDELPQTSATFVGTDGTELGAANLTGSPNGGVLIGVQIEGLPQGQWVAFHVHETGECDPEGGFQSAGGHYAPEGNMHGYFVEQGPHAGDMPNQLVPESGVLRGQVFNHKVTIDGENAIRGRALMFHALPDDYVSQPSGNAGDRIACAVIE
jgi:superoxide dismutase, Cu-Zn family